jgi:hypothetical protein
MRPVPKTVCGIMSSTYYPVKGSKPPEKLALEKAHAEVHKEMQDAAGKSHSHAAPFALSMILRSVSIGSKESHLERTCKAARNWRKNNPESHKTSYLRTQAKGKGLQGEEVPAWETKKFEEWKSGRACSRPSLLLDDRPLLLISSRRTPSLQKTSYQSTRVPTRLLTPET